MKLTVCMLVLVGAIVMVKGEECRDTGDCSHVTCPENDFTLDCHNRQCTCTQTGSKCSGANDCHGNCNRDWHCVDGACRCGFGFGGGLGGIGK